MCSENIRESRAQIRVIFRNRLITDLKLHGCRQMCLHKIAKTDLDPLRPKPFPHDTRVAHILQRTRDIVVDRYSPRPFSLVETSIAVGAWPGERTLMRPFVPIILVSSAVSAYG